MSYRGAQRGGGFRGGRGGSRGGYGNSAPEGPPDRVIEVGAYLHPSENDLVLKSTQSMIPYFNAPIYLENKQKIGKIDEILGPINQVYFTVKTDPNINASSFKEDTKFFIAPDKLLPASRFTNPSRGGGGGRGRGAPRGGFGRGGGRGGFSSRGGSFSRGGAGGSGGRGGFSRGGRGSPYSRGGNRGGGRGR